MTCSHNPRIRADPRLLEGRKMAKQTVMQQGKAAPGLDPDHVLGAPSVPWYWQQDAPGKVCPGGVPAQRV